MFPFVALIGKLWNRFVVMVEESNAGVQLACPLRLEVDSI
jgi:hypothetical protein